MDQDTLFRLTLVRVFFMIGRLCLYFLPVRVELVLHNWGMILSYGFILFSFIHMNILLNVYLF